jgi:hypothetical protein
MRAKEVVRVNSPPHYPPYNGGMEKEAIGDASSQYTIQLTRRARVSKRGDTPLDSQLGGMYQVAEKEVKEPK